MMNKFLLALSTIFISSIFASVTAQELTFKQTHVNIGELQYGKDTSLIVDYHFTNTGDQLLKIKTVLVSCGCTKPTWKKEGYQPGEKGIITLNYHLDSRVDAQLNITAEVYSNAINKGTTKGVHNLSLNGKIKGNFPILTPHYSLPIIPKKNTSDNTNDVYSTILSRVKNELLRNYSSKNDSKVEQLVSTIRRGGYWQHIDYGCYFRTNWQPVDHLSNLKEMAKAYVTPLSKYQGNDSLFQIIYDGLNYWDIANPRSHNWWFNQIGGSQQLADLLVLLHFGYKKLPNTLLQSLYKELAQSDPRKWTGANKLDIARHHLYRGCLVKNDSIIEVAASESFYPIHITSKEGIQEDFSYHQHGNQLYFGGYGVVLVSGIVELASYLQNTPYALDQNRMDIFTDFLCKGYLQVFRSGYIDFSVTGRGISRKGNIDYKGTVGLIEKAALLAPAKINEFQRIIKHFKGESNEKESGISNNINFWRSDYMIHNRPSYQASVRSSSVRCCKTESGNGENLLGAFLSDGALMIRQNGDEYYNIFPIWEWDKIPGTTTPIGVNKIGGGWSQKGKSILTGGVSNGMIGAYAYEQDEHGVQAQKAYFFFDQFVVALGNTIQPSQDNLKLQTTLNQCLSKGDVSIYQKQGRQYKKYDSPLVDGKEYAIVHDNIAYVAMQPASLRLANRSQKGSWSTINYNEHNKMLEDSVFNLTWNHHNNNSYAYMLIPDFKQTKQIREIEKSIEWINTKSVQAINHKSQECAMILFHEKGEYQLNDFSIQVDHPAYLILQKDDNKITLTLSNPLQNNKAIQVKIKRKQIKYSKTFETYLGKPQQHVFAL